MTMTLGKSRTMPRPGDKCECKDCEGRLYVYVTRINFTRQVRIRYLKCSECGYLPEENKWIVPLEWAPPKQGA